MIRNNIALVQGQSYSATYTTNIDITGYSVFGQIRQGYDSMIGYDFDIVVLDAATGQISISLPATATELMKARTHVYDIEAINDADPSIAVKLVVGQATVRAGVTRTNVMVPAEVPYQDDVYVNKVNATGETLYIGMPVALDMVGNIVKCSEYNADRYLGLVQDNQIPSGMAGKIKVEGILTASITQWLEIVGDFLTVGETYFVNGAGKLSVNPPQYEWSRAVGQAISPIQMDIKNYNPVKIMPAPTPTPAP